MSTLIELIRAGELVKLDPDLDADQLEHRCIYVFPHVPQQVERLVAAVSDLGVEQTPLEQLDDLVYHFATGGELNTPRQFHIMHPRGDGIWELKTADLRVLGWFYRRDCFICTAILPCQLVKGTIDGVPSSGSLYTGLCADAVRRRGVLELDPPEYVPGEHPENVISNYSCS
jgi:hypothetical protein